jgi:Flp pilus assembly protein TadB
MDLLNIIHQIETQLPMALLAALGGLAVFGMFFALIAPAKGRPASVASYRPTRQLAGIQTRLDKAHIEIAAGEFVRRSLILGAPLGLGLFVLIGSITLLPVGLLAGFLFTWNKLEQERDRKQVRYSKQLASVCDTIRTAYGVNPSLKKAIEAAAEYSLSPIKEDFQEIIVAINQERFVEGLQAVADRRRSIVFDTVATTLIRANEATGEVGDMLQRLAESTRQNTAAFEDAISSQINARSNIQWGTYGPWIVFCVFKGMTTMMALFASGSTNLFGGMTTFFSTPAGNLIALVAALISIFVYRHCQSLSQRGLVVRRVNTSALAEPKLGQKPISGQTSILSGQGRPAAI